MDHLIPCDDTEAVDAQLHIRNLLHYILYLGQDGEYHPGLSGADRPQIADWWSP